MDAVAVWITPRIRIAFNIVVRIEGASKKQSRMVECCVKLKYIVIVICRTVLKEEVSPPREILGEGSASENQQI